MTLQGINVRVKKHPKGWVVEQKFCFLWKHSISVSGINSEPWYFKTKEMAINEAIRYFKYDLLRNSC